jgi:hypothetical protein
VSPATTSQVAPAQEAGLPQPQTTAEPPGGPFIRYANAGAKQQWALTNLAFGAVVTQPLVACPGYLRKFRLRFAATNGSGTTTVAATADAPFSAVGFLQLKDAFGTPLLTGDGYSMLQLWPKYSGGHFLETYNDPSSLPSWSAIATGVSASGNFTFQTALPIEFAKGYGCISMANSSLLPQLQINLNPSTSVYSVAPNTALPVIEIDNYSEFYWLPQQQIEPPGLGSTRQAVLQVANPPIGTGSSQQVTFPRLGGYVDTFILVLRDSTNARIDAWPTELRFYVDGIPLIALRTDMIYDDMANAYQYNSGVATARRETGVIVITRKQSLGQIVMGLLDSLEVTLSTNPGTLLAVEGMPWGTIANAPANLNVIAGQIVPSGRLLQGLPEI